MQLLSNTLGRKVLMAATGLFMPLFVAVHLLGNSSIFAGPGGVNAYAAKLHGLGPFVWVFRLFMGAMLAVHLIFGVLLTLDNRAANPGKYAVKKMLKATFASETMIWTGLLPLAFVVFPLLDPTVGAVVAVAGFQHLQAFQNVVATFHSPLKVAAYGISLVSLGLHLSHGLYSMFQSLGFRHPLWTPTIQKAAVVLAFFLALFYLFIPAGVVFGRIY